MPSGAVPEKASPTAELKAQPLVSIPANTEPPIELYEEKNGLPYAAELLDIKVLYGKTGQEAQIQAIDRYVLDTIEREGLKSTMESYASVIEDIEERLGLNKNIDYPDHIDKLFAYTKMLAQEQQLKQMRQLFNAH